MSLASTIATIQTDEQKAIAFVGTELTHLKEEGAAIMAWVNREVPGSAGAVAVWLQAAEGEAADLARKAANGLSSQIAAGASEAETFMANLINATGFSTNVKTGVNSLDTSAVALLASIGKGLISTALASILGKLALAAAA